MHPIDVISLLTLFQHRSKMSATNHLGQVVYLAVSELVVTDPNFMSTGFEAIKLALISGIIQIVLLKGAINAAAYE